MNYELRIRNWVRILCVLLALGSVALGQQKMTNTAVMLQGETLLPNNAATVISNALGLGPFATNTNIIIANVDGLQGTLDSKLATNGILPSYTNIAGLQPWSTNTNTPIFVDINGTVQNSGAITFPVLRTSESNVMLGNGAMAYGGGGAMGNGAYTDDGGGAMGNGAYTDSGGAVGNGAYAHNGFAGGVFAKANGPNNVQLGTGTNATDGTMQFLSFPLVAADGKIPVERFPAWASTNPAAVRTNLGLGATNSVTFADITNTGDTTLGDAAGDSMTVNAGSFTAPNATATNGNSVMTRDLTEWNDLWQPKMAFINRVNASAVNGAYVGADRTDFSVNTKTNDGAYAQVRMAYGLNMTTSSGALADLSSPFSIRFVGISSVATNAVSATRIVMESSITTKTNLADTDAIQNKGWGVEIRSGAGNTYDQNIRLVYHDGTNYSSTAAVPFIPGNTQTFFTLILENAGAGVMRVYAATNGVPGGRPSATPILEITNGPTGNLTAGGLFLQAAQPSTNAVPLSSSAIIHNAEIFYGEMKK